MDYIHFETLQQESYKNDVWELLCRYDHTFIPALSSRQSTSQSNLLQKNNENKPYTYFNNILKQSIIVAVNEQDQVIGFMSYKPDYISSELQDNVSTLYITTIIVDEAYRGKGITTTFYKEIEKVARTYNKPIMTRTWSTNTAHIHVLQKVGLVEIKRIEHARGPNIDTVYYRKHIGG